MNFVRMPLDTQSITCIVYRFGFTSFMHSSSSLVNNRSWEEVQNRRHRNRDNIVLMPTTGPRNSCWCLHVPRYPGMSVAKINIQWYCRPYWPCLGHFRTDSHGCCSFRKLLNRAFHYVPKICIYVLWGPTIEGGIRVKDFCFWDTLLCPFYKVHSTLISFYFSCKLPQHKQRRWRWWRFKDATNIVLLFWNRPLVPNVLRILYKSFCRYI